MKKQTAEQDESKGKLLPIARCRKKWRWRCFFLLLLLLLLLVLVLAMLSKRIFKLVCRLFQTYAAKRRPQSQSPSLSQTQS